MYDVKKISVTQLESFLSCPKRFEYTINGQEGCNKKAPLDIGTLFHLAIQSPELALAMFNVTQNGLTLKERKQLEELIRHSSRFEKAHAYEVGVSAVVKNTLLTGHIDEVFIYPANDIIDEPTIKIVDNKTTSSKWTMETFKEMKQKFMYPYLMYRQTGIKNIIFEYRVFPKKQIIVDEDIRIFREYINMEECSVLVNNWIEIYEDHISQNNFPASPNMSCFYCQYRHVCEQGFKRKTKEEKEEQKIDVNFAFELDMPDWDMDKRSEINNK